MALLNTGCLVSTIQADVTGLTTGSPVECFVILAAGLDSAISDRCVTVPTSGSLPNLWPTQSVPQGQVMFVEDVGVPVIAAQGKWIGFDQRTFRNDAPIGVLFTWGYSLNGDLAGDPLVTRSSPTTVTGGGSNWCAISAGGCSAMFGLKTDGTLWSWGSNLGGKLGIGTSGGGTSRSSPGTVAGGGTNWCALSLNNSGVGGAIKTDGTLWTWGRNDYGQLGDGSTLSRLSPVTTAGGGTTWCSLGSSEIHVLATKTDGTLWTWGSNSLYQLGDGTATDRSSPVTVAGGGTNWCFVSAGGSSSAAIKSDGALWMWGANFNGMLGDGTTTSRSSPVTVAGGGTTWCFVSIGSQSSAGIKTDGTLWTWGANTFGQLGDGTTTARCSPVSIAGGGTTWCFVSVGTYNMAGVKTDGTLWTWGSDSNKYMLGTGTGFGSSGRCSPGTVAGGTAVWRRASMSNYLYSGAIRASI